MLHFGLVLHNLTSHFTMRVFQITLEWLAVLIGIYIHHYNNNYKR